MNLPGLRRRPRTRVRMLLSVDLNPAGELVDLDPELAGLWLAAGYCEYVSGARPSAVQGRAFEEALELRQDVDV